MRLSAAAHVRRVLVVSLFVHVLVLLLLFASCTQLALLHATRFHASAPKVLHHRAPYNQLLLLDGWERMVNIQYMLRRVVHIALDANFTLVEPFVYESKISLWRSLPEMLHAQNLSAQTAATYFDTQPLYHSKRYISYRQFEQRAGVQAHPQTLFIHAVLFFTWRDEPLNRSYRAGASANSTRPFFWCDHKLRQLPGRFNHTSNTHQLTRSVHVARALCVSPSALTNGSFFKRLFTLARSHAASPHLTCAQCTSVAVANYRKHAVQSYRTVFGDRPSAHRVPPLSPSAHVRSLASTFIQQTFGNSPFVAMHLRSGKAYTLLASHNDSVFAGWLHGCTSRLLHAAHSKRLPVFVASDLFNDGWRGGEAASASAQHALRRARRALLSGGARRFDARALAQDRMGLASAVDAAVCARASALLWARPSSFGQWVSELRAARGDASSSVPCAPPPPPPPPPPPRAP